MTAEVTLAVIRTPENLIDQKEGWHVFVRLRCREQLFQTLHLRIKIGKPILNGIAHLDAAEKLKQRKMQPFGIYWSSRIGQTEIYPDSPQEGALSRHV